MIRFKLNRKGVRRILREGGAPELCMKYAEHMRDAAGPGYEVAVRRYEERTGAAVYPGDAEAFYDNLANNTLEKVRRSV